MANLQVKNMPEDLHAAVARRAREQGMTITRFVTQVLARETDKPSPAEWLARAQRAFPDSQRRVIDTQAALDGIRGPWPVRESGQPG